MTYQISRVAPEFAPKVWGQIEEFIEKALRRGDALKYSRPAHILGHIVFDRMQLWVAHEANIIDAAAVTRINEWDTGWKTLYVPIIGGRNMKAWENELDAELEKFARSKGCNDLGGELRKGWARRPGWEVTGVTLKKALN